MIVSVTISFGINAQTSARVKIGNSSRLSSGLLKLFTSLWSKVLSLAFSALMPLAMSVADSCGVRVGFIFFGVFVILLVSVASGIRDFDF